MSQYSIGEAIKIFLERNNYKAKADEIRLKKDWALVAGATIAKYTKNLKLHQQVLYISTDIAPLKQELLLSKNQLIARINEHFKEQMVKDVVVR